MHLRGGCDYPCVCVCVCSRRDCNTQIQALQFNETISCSLQNYKPIIINMVILQKLVSETPLGTPITVITNIIQSSSEMIMLNNILDPIQTCLFLLTSWVYLTWLFSINWNPQYPLYLHKRGEEGGNLKPGGRMFYFDLYKIQQLISM